MNRDEILAEAMRRAALADPERMTAADFERFQHEVEAVKAEQSAPPAQATGGQEPWRSHLEPDQRSDRQVALALLEAEGLPRAQALETLALDSSATERLAEQISAARAADQEQREEQARRAYGASPAGLREQGQALLVAEQEQAQMIEEGTALLKARGEYDPSDPPDTILRLSGLVQPEPDPSDSLQANIDAATDGASE